MKHLSLMTGPHWLLLYGAILLSWGGLWIWSSPSSDISRLWLDLCLSTPKTVSPLSVFAMWLLMSLAMMLPTALPAFATYDHIAESQGVTGGMFLVAGYCLVWIAFSGVASWVQLVLPTQQSQSFAPVLLILAAAYQITPLKAAYLSRCRQPLTFFMGHWDEGPWRMGLRLGGVCLGCCWALMGLALIGGAMSLAFMALTTVLIALEKFSRGTWVPRLISITCLLVAGYLVGGLA